MSSKVSRIRKPYWTSKLFTIYPVNTASTWLQLFCPQTRKYPSNANNSKSQPTFLSITYTIHPPFYNGVWFKWRCGVLWPRAVLLCIHDLSHHRVMPPRKGIVKSGNAGNSSKSTVPSSSTPSSTTPGLDTPPPLFPPGSKYPLSLLNERWVKPHLETSPQQTRLVNSYPRIWQQLDVCAQCSWSKLTCRCQKEGWEKPVVDTVYVSLYWGYISLIIFLPATPRQWMVVCSEFKSTQ